jgi:hypothetical protein
VPVVVVSMKLSRKLDSREASKAGPVPHVTAIPRIAVMLTAPRYGKLGNAVRSNWEMPKLIIATITAAG